MLTSLHDMTTLRSSRLVRAFLLVAAFSGSAHRLAAQGPDPLAPLVAEALRANLGLEVERLGERRAAADVRAARALFLPALELQSRYSRLDGVPNIGNFVNPAYAALNGILGENRFPTNLDITLPPRHDSRVTVRQPLFNAGILANYSIARSRADGQMFGRLAAARRLAADVQSAYLTQASARRAVDIYAAALTLVQENERVAGRLVAAGRAIPEALFRARADRSEIEQQLAEARQKHAAAARVLNQMLRRPLNAAIDDIPDSAFNLPLTISPENAVAHGLQGREELRTREAELSDLERELTDSVRDIAALPIEIVGMSDDLTLTRQAAIYKATHKMAYADCFAAALAKLKNAELLTGDPKFKPLEKEIKINWLK